MNSKPLQVLFNNNSGIIDGKNNILIILNSGKTPNFACAGGTAFYI